MAPWIPNYSGEQLRGADAMIGNTFDTLNSTAPMSVADMYRGIYPPAKAAGPALMPGMSVADMYRGIYPPAGTQLANRTVTTIPVDPRTGRPTNTRTSAPGSGLTLAQMFAMRDTGADDSFNPAVEEQVYRAPRTTLGYQSGQEGGTDYRLLPGDQGMDFAGGNPAVDAVTRLAEGLIAPVPHTRTGMVAPIPAVRSRMVAPIPATRTALVAPIPAERGGIGGPFEFDEGVAKKPRTLGAMFGLPATRQRGGTPPPSKTIAANPTRYGETSAARKANTELRAQRLSDATGRTGLAASTGPQSNNNSADADAWTRNPRFKKGGDLYSQRPGA